MPGCLQPCWLWDAAKHSHTTHVLSNAKIHYPHHPHCGHAVTLVRKCFSFGRHQVQVAFPNGDQLLIPEWMLDEDLCRGMEVVESPTLALSALVALRGLVDAQQSTPRVAGTVASETSSSGGASREPTTSGSSSLGESPQAGVSSSNRAALPRATDAHAAGGRKHNSRQQRGGEQ
jgi:hypothetical protein